jgi:hypothetical protein
MRSPRWILAVTAVCAVTALSSCSGSDSGQDADAPASTAASDAGTPDKAFHRKCTAEIQITGVAEASWSGKGSSSNQAGPTIYDFAKGKDRLSVYAGEDDIPTTANFTIDGATCAFALVRWARVERAMRTRQPLPAFSLAFVMTGAVVLGAVLLALAFV